MAEDRKPIVVGVDDSEAGRRALAWALDEATVRGCRVEAVTVWSPEPVHDMVWTSGDETRGSHEQRLRIAVQDALKGRTDPPEVTETAVEGDPEHVLVQAARDSAMLVVAPHRGERVRKMVLGSVSAGCVRHATVPVVMVTRDAG